MTIAPYDFRKPSRLAGSCEDALAGWLRRASAQATKSWQRRLPFPMEWTFHGFDTFRPPDALARLAETALGYRLRLARGITTVLAVPRPLALAIASALIGDVGTTLPGDRDLTVVEESLFECFLTEQALPSLNETWPGAEPARLELLQAEPNPRWTRLFGSDTPLVMSTFLWSGPFGVDEWFWLLPREELAKILAEPEAPAPAAATALDTTRLEARVQEVPVELTVLLGSVEVRLSQLSELRAGDLLVLNQRVSEPLTAAVGQEKKYRGWAGRIGSAQAFKVESLLKR